MGERVSAYESDEGVRHIKGYLWYSPFNGSYYCALLWTTDSLPDLPVNSMYFGGPLHPEFGQVIG